MEEKQCLHVKNIRQITQGDKKPTNTQSNSKRENDKKKYEAGMSDNNKRKENRNWKGT